MENGPVIIDVPVKIVIFHSYVILPEGTTRFVVVMWARSIAHP